MWANFPFLGGFNKYKGLDFDTEDIINLYVIKDPKGKKGIALLNTPGLNIEKIVQSGNAPARGLFAFNDKMYGVFGSNIYSFDSLLTKNYLGSIGTNIGQVSITANNGNQIIFIDGQSGYIHNTLTGSFGKITSSDFPPSPLNVAFLDTYFVIPSANSQQFQLSANNDGTKWNALHDSAQIQTYPGKLIGVGVVNERLFFFKTESTEIWYNTGSADFPLRQDRNLIFNYGCSATSSIASEYGYLFWLAKDKGGASSVMMTTGQVPERVSNFAVENIIATFIDPSDVQCFIYKEEGNIFYVMSWTTDDITLVYNVATNEWHRMEMEKYLPVPSIPYHHKTRHVASCHCYFNNTHYIGSYKAPVLYSMSRQYPDNAGEPIKRERTASAFFDESYRTFQIKLFQVDIQPGIGDETGIYINPQAYLSFSKDGGHVFGNQQTASIGKIGNRQTRTIWRKKGLCRSFVPRVTIYASVAPIVIMGASMEYEVLPK